MFGFAYAQDITSMQREQWAGLFQARLQRDREDGQRDILVTLEGTLRTANDLAKLLGERVERIASPEAVEKVLLSNHPAFAALRRHMKVDYPTPFYNLDELKARLKGWGFVDVTQMNDDKAV